VFLAVHHQKQGDLTIRRPMNGQMPPKDDGPRVNDAITSNTVLVIDDEGEKRGVMKTEAAIALAEEAGLDLVEVSPNAEPPVCKIMDYGKYKYQAQKKAAEARKKQKVIEVKEIKLRPGIDTHDYDVKMRAMKRFFEEGDKVKVTMRFRGREMAHTELGFDLLQKVKADTEEIAKVEFEPKMEGRQMIMILAPR
jgi:translation initiation factor IF-3